MTEKISIVQKDHPALRQISEEIALDKIHSPEIKDLIKKMETTLKAETDGVALAAPQIGVNKRLFIVSGKIFTSPDSDTEPPIKIFINPEIKKMSKKKIQLEEGCLSVRPLYGHILRSEKISIIAYDQEGKKKSWNASGLLAQIFQHEIDHLNGILFIDQASDFYEITE
jgi:peptide deformylase